MWVYEPQKPETEGTILIPEHTALPLLPQETAGQEQPVSDSRPAEQTTPPGKTVTPSKRSRAARKKPTRDCWLLAAAFLLGTAAAGWLQAVRDAQQGEALAYFLSIWQGMFTVPDLHAASKLFCAEYAALTAAATLLLLLGLSALGPVLIFLLSMLYGLGNGLLFAQFFTGMEWKAALALLLLAAVPAACAAGCLCVFGASALQVSARIRAYSFRQQGGQAFSGARTLLGQYVLTLVVLLPMCGAATGLAYLGGTVF